MPRYLIERKFPQGLSNPLNADGHKAIDKVIANNSEQGVTCVQSFVTPDCNQTFCIYDAPSPEAIRKVADRNSLPCSVTTEVNVLDPYLYRS